MSSFRYKARDRSGQLITGEIEGENRWIIQQALVNQDLFPLSVQPKSFEFSWRSLKIRKLKLKDLATFTRQFQMMFAVGTPMDRILAILERQTRHPGLKESLQKINQDVSAGLRLSEAFAKHSDYFSPFYTSMLAVGESGGILDKILTEIASILQKEHRIQAQVRSATLYPKLVAGTLVLMTIFLLIFVIPTFQEFYTNYSAKLPWQTELLVQTSRLFTHYWYLICSAAVVLFYGWKRFRKTPRGQHWVATLWLKLPIFGRLRRLIMNARFGHRISVLYRSGLPLSEALDIVADTMDYPKYAEEVRALRQAIHQGQSLSSAMEDKSFFTPMLIEATAVGEQTGKLDETLETTAHFYDEEVDDMLKTLSTLIEPILLFLIFGLIALVALAVYLPVWNLTRVILHP